MPRVLFWNVQRRRLDRLVVSLAQANQPDLLVIIEPPPPAGLPRGLSTEGYSRVAGSDRFLIAVRSPLRLVRRPYPEPRARAEFWTASGGPGTWLLVIVHGPDRRNAPQDSTRAFLFRQLTTHAAQLERQAGHRKTVLFGDLNANPFEPSVMGAGGLHALGVRRVQGRTSRGVRNAGRADFFYNPMWRMYGTDPAADAGTGTYYYHQGYDATEPLWHMLDQVVIRPDWADRLPPDEIRILTSAGPHRLLTPGGLPDNDSASDHLPVAFSLLDT